MGWHWLRFIVFWMFFLGNNLVCCKWCWRRAFIQYSVYRQCQTKRDYSYWGQRWLPSKQSQNVCLVFIHIEPWIVCSTMNISRYKNRPKMSFDDVASKCDEELELAVNPTGDLEYPLKYAMLTESILSRSNIKLSHSSQTRSVFVGSSSDTVFSNEFRCVQYTHLLHRITRGVFGGASPWRDDLYLRVPTQCFRP